MRHPRSAEGAEPAMAQSFFKAGENGFLVTRLDVNHAVWRQARLRECRREQVLAGHAPQHLSARPPGDAAGKKGSSRTVDRAISTPGHFMQGAQRQPTSRQMPVDVSEAEGKHGTMVRGGTRWMRSRSCDVNWSLLGARMEGLCLGGASIDAENAERVRWRL